MLFFEIFYVFLDNIGVGGELSTFVTAFVVGGALLSLEKGDSGKLDCWVFFDKEILFGQSSFLG